MPSENVTEVETVDTEETLQSAETPLVKCVACGQLKPRSPRNMQLCVDCYKLRKNRDLHLRQKNMNWMDVAKEAGINLWERQPEETDTEFAVWTAYRDTYPNKRPSLVEVADKTGIPYPTCTKASARWDFSIRMQAYIAYIDRETTLQRREAMINLNRDSIDIAQRLRDKMRVAVDNLDPTMVKPGELATLLKLSDALERQAQLDTLSQEELRRDMTKDNDNPNLKKSQTKSDDLSEIIGILASSGALGDITHIGVRKTETTEVVVQDSEGGSARLLNANE